MSFVLLLILRKKYIRSCVRNSSFPLQQSKNFHCESELLQTRQGGRKHCLYSVSCKVHTEICKKIKHDGKNGNLSYLIQSTLLSRSFRYLLH